MEEELLICRLKNENTIFKIWEKLKDASNGPVPSIFLESELDMGAIYIFRKSMQMRKFHYDSGIRQQVKKIGLL